MKNVQPILVGISLSLLLVCTGLAVRDTYWPKTVSVPASVTAVGLGAVANSAPDSKVSSHQEGIYLGSSTKPPYANQVHETRWRIETEEEKNTLPAFHYHSEPSGDRISIEMEEQDGGVSVNSTGATTEISLSKIKHLYVNGKEWGPKQ